MSSVTNKPEYKLIDHHRTGTIHAVDQKVPGFGTKTLCGLTLPHYTDTADVDEEDELECKNCKRLKE